MYKLRIKLMRFMHKRIEKTVQKRRMLGKDTILFLISLLLTELTHHGYDVRGLDRTCVYLSIFKHKDVIEVSNNNGWEVKGRVE